MVKQTNKFLEGLIQKDNQTITENGAVTNRSTLSWVLDFFGLGCALRTRSNKDIHQIFSKAFNEDRGLAMKTLFYLRDIREGQGERRTFRVILKYLGNMYPEIIIKNFPIIAEFGRWDDFFALINTKAEKPMFQFIRAQIEKDLKSETPSLLGKWLKTNNTKCNKTVQLYHKIRLGLVYESVNYRKMVVALRKKIGVLEPKIHGKRYSEIEYDKIPSSSSLRYVKAFRRHDQERYDQFINDVKQGKKTIHVQTLYPYEILRKVLEDPNCDTYDLQWKSLKDCCPIAEDSIVVCDTSGSMNGLPILVAVSLAIYFGEHNKGVFHNHFISFSNIPRLQTIVGSTLYEKFNNLSQEGWDGNTNLEAVFRLILTTAIENQVPEEDMPKKIYIISDMEFDQAVQNKDVSNFENVKRMYMDSHYKLPQLVFWNVDARNNQVPIIIGDQIVYLVSGSSPNILKTLMTTKTQNAIEFMLEVLNQKRYQCVQI